MPGCSHENFMCNVDVNRLKDSGNFIADVRIHCSVCGSPFHFNGITEFGLLQTAPSLNADATELHLPIGPGELPVAGHLRYEFPHETIQLRKIAKAARSYLEVTTGRLTPAKLQQHTQQVLEARLELLELLATVELS